jgi:hypothetical protein
MEAKLHRTYLPYPPPAEATVGATPTPRTAPAEVSGQHGTDPRPASSPALHVADTTAIGTALHFRIKEIRHFIKLGGDSNFWQSKLDDAMAAMAKIEAIQATV